MTERQKYYPEYYLPDSLTGILYTDSAPQCPQKDEILLSEPQFNLTFRQKLVGMFTDRFNNRRFEEFRKRKALYERRLQLYNYEIKLYNRRKSLYEKSEDISQYRHKLLQMLIEQNNPLSYGEIAKAKSSEVTKGPGETYFQKFLMIHGETDTYFTENFVMLRNKNVWFDRHTRYYPDILLKDKHGLCFDVEIDEPYSVSETKDPIHYLNYDDMRNTTFIDNGWVVIRFAEQQIFHSPLMCYQMITDIHKAIYTCDKALLHINEKLSLPKWTEKDAREMAQSDFRTTYLPYKIQKESKQGNG